MHHERDNVTLALVHKCNVCRKFEYQCETDMLPERRYIKCSTCEVRVHRHCQKQVLIIMTDLVDVQPVLMASKLQLFTMFLFVSGNHFHIDSPIDPTKCTEIIRPAEGFPRQCKNRPLRNDEKCRQHDARRRTARTAQRQNDIDTRRNYQRGRLAVRRQRERETILSNSRFGYPFCRNDVRAILIIFEEPNLPLNYSFFSFFFFF